MQKLDGSSLMLYHLCLFTALSINFSLLCYYIVYSIHHLILTWFYSEVYVCLQYSALPSPSVLCIYSEVFVYLQYLASIVFLQ